MKPELKATCKYIGPNGHQYTVSITRNGRTVTDDLTLDLLGEGSLTVLEAFCRKHEILLDDLIECLKRAAEEPALSMN
ncbi:MAG: hypothetical protein AB1405_00125 [Bdellovibrionota bacterium]